nr:MAG: hypothetical protein DIU74_10305 [Pseudomonadota bacterium]
MKLASLNDGTRDGALCVVSRDLKYATVAYDIAPTLQAALDDWDYLAPLLGELYEQANRAPSGSRWFEFDPCRFAAPLPRAYAWIGASAYPSHMERLRSARGLPLPEDFRKEPWLLNGRADAALAGHEDILLDDEALQLDLEAEIAVVTGDVPRGVKRERAGEHIRLFVLANDLTARALVSAELTKGNGLFHAKTALAFAPVAVTPDELGAAWDGRRVHLPLEVQLNDEPLGLPHAGTDMAFDFPALIAAAARMRDLRAGTIIGSGAVSNRDASVGACSLAEKRALQEEALDAPLLRIGDRIRIEMRAADGQSIFGAIAQTVVHPDRRDPQEGASSGASSDTAPADQAA